MTLRTEGSAAVLGVPGAGRPALRRVIAVDPPRFAEEHWGSAPLLSRAADLPGGFADLVTLADFDELLSRRGLRTPFVRMAKNGQVLATTRFTRSGGAGAEIADQVADDKVLGLFADGATVVLQGLHRVWPPVMEFAAQLAEDLGHPVQVNAYITPPSSRGFSTHYDVHDVFVVQIAGEKRWRIHEPVLDAPLRDQPWTSYEHAVEAKGKTQPLVDAVLSPGDVLYLPRGFLHAAEALGATSAHLTVGVQPVTRFAIVEALLRELEQHRELRQSLPLGLLLGRGDDVVEEVGITLERLVQAVRSIDRSAVANRVAADAANMTRPSAIAPLAQAALLHTLTLDTTLRRRPHLAASVTTHGASCRIRLADRDISLPAEGFEAIQLLLSGEEVRVDDLPLQHAEDRMSLARRLLREAVVVPARSGTRP